MNAAWTPFGVISPHLDANGKPQQWIVDEFEQYNGRSADNFDPENDGHVKVPDGLTARRAIGDNAREYYTKQFKRDHTQVSDSELMDALVYNVFPNFAPWGGFMPNIVYRWKTWTDPDHCIMEVRVLARVAPGEPRPRSVPCNFLREDQKWTEAKELGILGDVFEQDMDNLPFVQEGLKCSPNNRVELGDYQEIRIRQFHQTIDKYLAK